MLISHTTRCPGKEAIAAMRGKAIHKQYSLLAFDETVLNLACFYKYQQFQ